MTKKLVKMNNNFKYVTAFYLGASKQAALTTKLAYYDHTMEDLIGHNIEVYKKKLNCGIKIKILACGLILIDFEKLPVGNARDEDYNGIENAIHNRLIVINCFLSFFYTAYKSQFNRPKINLQISYITHEDIFHADSLDRPGDVFWTDKREDINHAINNTIKKKISSAKTLNISDFSIDKTLVDMVCKDLNHLIINKHSEILKLIDLLLSSRRDYTSHQCSHSLIKAWTVCEYIISMEFKELVNNKKVIKIKGKEARINRKTRDNFLTSTDYTVSIKTDILILFGRITPDLHNNLKEVRSKRNAWMHSMSDIDLLIAERAIQTAEALLKYTQNVAIEIPLTYSVWFI